MLPILAFIFVLLFVRNYFNSDPPIEATSTKNINYYLETNKYVKNLLKENYNDMFPQKIPSNCAAEYLYEYSCDFDGRLYLTLFLKLKYDADQDYNIAKSQTIENSTANLMEAGNGKHFLVYDSASMDNYYLNPEKIYTGYKIAFIELDDEEFSINYILLKQYSNDKQLDKAVEFLLADFENIQ